jgi:hypothetical protein
MEKDGPVTRRGGLIVWDLPRHSYLRASCHEETTNGQDPGNLIRHRHDVKVRPLIGTSNGTAGTYGDLETRIMLVAPRDRRQAAPSALRGGRDAPLGGPQVGAGEAGGGPSRCDRSGQARRFDRRWAFATISTQISKRHGGLDSDLQRLLRTVSSIIKIAVDVHCYLPSEPTAGNLDQEADVF